MQRIHLVVAAVAVLSATPAAAQSRYPDPLVLVGPGASIGVRVRELTTSDQEAARLDSAAGAYVETIAADSPAATAGLKTGDIILEFDGERVRGVRSMARLVSETPPRRMVKVVIAREGMRRTLEVTPEPETRSRF